MNKVNQINQIINELSKSLINQILDNKFTKLIEQERNETDNLIK